MGATSVKDMNDSIAKQAALSDSRFSKTVKDIGAARTEAAKQVSDARKTFATSLAALTSSVKDQETRLAGDIEVVASLELSNKAMQIRTNDHTQKEMKRIMRLVNDNSSESKRARGKIRDLLNENKRAAHEEVQALDKLFEGKIAKIRSKASANSAEAARDLTQATKKMYNTLSGVQLKALYDNKLSVAAIAKYENDAAKDIAAAKKAAKLDRELIKTQTASMQKDMNKRIVKAIQKGEAEAKRVAEDARVSLNGMKKAMLVEIAEKVENAADKLFATIQGNHQKLADNYLSLKAYAVTASAALKDYVSKGKGKNLSSLGDLLMTVNALSDIKEVKAEGVGFGADSLPAIFTDDAVPVSRAVSKINGLVNEYTTVTNAVRMRWPMGLGKYLLSKLEESMLEKGVLQVDKVQGKSGNFVYLNGHAVGLSNKLNDFESLAVRMASYESGLAKLTASLSGKVHHLIAAKKLQDVKAPEWQGD